MADKLTREEKRVMLRERYGSAFAPPLPKKQGGRPKSSKNKKKGDPETITLEDYRGL